jgi:4-amino-4-deoxy-L-arabinose transferase-like glycosyltransferase
MATDATPARWRSERPFLVTLGLAALVRLVVATSFPPAFLMSDAPTYLTISHHLTPSPDRPIAYSMFLRALSEVTGSLLLVTSAQLVLGLLTGVAAYAWLRRRAVSPWVATLATVPMLFDAMQLLLEHAVLSDVLFDFLMVTAVTALAWWTEPRWWTTALAGVLFGLATVVRVVGEPTVVLAALFLVLVATSWRNRIAQVAILVAAFALPVTAYATWYHHENGAWAITEASGRALYMRTTTFVDCDTIQVPDYERVLCPDDPLGSRNDPTWYGWHSPETVPRLDPPQGVSDRHAMRDFAVRAIEHQPGDYARVVWRDFRLGFTALDRDNHYEMSTSAKWAFGTLLDYENSSAWARAELQSHIGHVPQPRQPMADAMTAYGRFVFVPGPLALALAVLAVAGIVVRRREEEVPLRPAILLTLALPVTLVLVPDVTAQFVWRYQLPLVVLLPLSAALGWTRLRRYPGRRATPSTD